MKLFSTLVADLEREDSARSDYVVEELKPLVDALTTEQERSRYIVVTASPDDEQKAVQHVLEYVCLAAAARGDRALYVANMSVPIGGLVHGVRASTTRRLEARRLQKRGAALGMEGDLEVTGGGCYQLRLASGQGRGHGAGVVRVEGVRGALHGSRFDVIVAHRPLLDVVNEARELHETQDPQHHSDVAMWIRTSMACRLVIGGVCVVVLDGRYPEMEGGDFAQRLMDNGWRWMDFR